MPENTRLMLACCTENQITAEEISAQLSKAGYKIELLGCAGDSPSGSLGPAIGQFKGKVILLVTDNFLKSATCLWGTLSAVQKLSEEGRLITVVAAGREPAEDGSGWESVPTSFERVSQVIHYMNYWQDKYLDLRKERRANDTPQLQAELETTRRISSEIGELLRYLRNQKFYPLEDFQKDAYRIFFRIMEDVKGHEKLKMESGIPFAPPAEPEPEKTLAELIEDSGEDIIAENSELDVPNMESLAEEFPEESLEDIPGMSLLKERENEGQAEEQAPGEGREETTLEDLPELEISTPDEVDSLIEEVMAEEAGDEEADISEEELEDLEDLFVQAEENPAEQKPEKTLRPVPERAETPSAGETLEVAVGLLEAGKKEQGIAFLKGALEARPEDPSLRYYLAYALARYAEDYSGAVAELQTLLHRYDDNADGWYMLAELTEIRQDYASAKAYFEKVAALKPDYPEVYYRLGLLMLYHFEDAENEALAFFIKALKQDDSNPDIHYRLAMLYNEQFGDSQQAIWHFQKTLQLQPEHPFANYDLALLYHKLGNPALAYEHYQKAASINQELKNEQNEAAFTYPLEGVLSEEKTAAEDEYVETVVAEAAEDLVAIEEETGESGLEDIFAPPKKEEAAGNEQDGNVDAAPVLEVAPSEEDWEREEEVVAPEAPGVSEGKIVLITGATSGIGKATADIFAKNGYRVIATGRRKERLEELKNRLSENPNADVLTLPFDVRNPDEVKDAIENLPEAWRNVDILINNAGLSRGLAPIHEGDIRHWETMIDTNIKGLLYLTRAIAPQMVERRSGHIINVSSAAGKEVYPNGNVYCATKFAVDALTQGMRLDLFKHNIRVSQVAPGHVEETEFARVRFDGDTGRAAKVYENFQPLKASDVAEVIFFIATRPPYVNIQDVLMYGTQQAGTNFIERSGRE